MYVTNCGNALKNNRFHRLKPKKILGRFRRKCGKMSVKSSTDCNKGCCHFMERHLHQSRAFSILRYDMTPMPIGRCIAQ